MQAQLFEAAVLLGVGMAVVFAFLTMLILGVHLITAFVKRFPGEQTATAYQSRTAQAGVSQSASAQNANDSTIDPDIVAAITAAVKQYRTKQ